MSHGGRADAKALEASAGGQWIQWDMGGARWPHPSSHVHGRGSPNGAVVLMTGLNKAGCNMAVGSSGGEPTARTQGWFEQLRGPEARRGKSSRRSGMSAEDISGVWGGG